MTRDRTGTTVGEQLPFVSAPLDVEGMPWRKLAESFVEWQPDVEELAIGQQPGNC